LVLYVLNLRKKREGLTYGSPRRRWFKPQSLVVGGLNIFKMVGVSVGVVTVLLDHLLEKADGVPEKQL
jgi:hypothetical protein